MAREGSRVPEAASWTWQQVWARCRHRASHTRAALGSPRHGGLRSTAAHPAPARRRPAGAGCSSPNINAKWSASAGISGQAPILGYNPADYAACCARCAGVSGCASFTFLSRPASVGNLCYLYRAGATIISTLPSTFSTFKTGEGESSWADA